MEELRIIKEGAVDINYSLDKGYKPGLYKQTEDLLNNDFSKHCNITEQVAKMKYYYHMANYQ